MSAENRSGGELSGDRGYGGSERRRQITSSERAAAVASGEIRSKEVATTEGRSIVPGVPRLMQGLEFPRIKAGQESQERLAEHRRMLQEALIQAYYQGEAVVQGWVRNKRRGDVTVVLGGETLIGNETEEDGKTLINFPPGSKGTELDQGALNADLSKFTAWKKLAGTRDMPKADEIEKLLETDGVPLEDQFLKGYDGAFSYFVVARPIPHEDIVMRARLVERQLREANAYDSAKWKKRAEELEAEFTLLKEGEVEGYWETSVYVGAQTETELNRVAQGISRLAQVCDHKLQPDEEVHGSFAEAQSYDTEETALPLSSGSLRMLTAVPKSRQEVPGIRLVNHPEFLDVTPESLNDPEDQRIKLGKVMHNGKVTNTDFEAGHDNLVRHSLVVGASGSGKSKLIDAMLEELARTGKKFLIIDPVKTDHRRLGAILAEIDELNDADKEVVLIRPGETEDIGGESSIPVSLNLMEEEPDFPLRMHIDTVTALIMSTYQAEEPFPQILKESMEKLYKRYGINLTTGKSRYPERPPRPNLEDLILEGQESVDDIKYGPEVHANISGFMKVRLGGLRTGSAASFVEGGYPINMGKLLDTNTLLELERIKVAEEKAFIMGMVLIRLAEHLYVQQDPEEEGLKFEVCLEEAHNLLSKQAAGSALASSVEQLGNFIAEIRDKGVGMLLTDQRPSLLHEGAIANTDLKVALRLDLAEDYQAMGNAMHLHPDDAGYMTEQEIGEALAKRGGMDHPVQINAPDPRQKPNRRDMLVSPRKIVDEVPGWNEFYSVEEVSNAQEFLDNPEKGQSTSLNGRRIRAWAELSVVGQLMGFGVVKPDRRSGKDGKMFFDINAITEVDRKTLQCAIGIAVRDAVDMRWREVVPHMSREDLITYVSEVMLANLDGEDLSDELQLDLVPKVNRFARPKFELTKAIVDHQNNAAAAEAITFIESLTKKIDEGNRPEGHAVLIPMIAPQLSGQIALSQENVREKLASYAEVITTRDEEGVEEEQSSQIETGEAQKFLDKYEKIAEIYARIRRRDANPPDFVSIIRKSAAPYSAELGVSEADYIKEMLLIKSAMEVAQIVEDIQSGDDEASFLDIGQIVTPIISKKTHRLEGPILKKLHEYNNASADEKRKIKERAVFPGPHPDTAKWEKAYKRKIPGRTIEGQEKSLAQWESKFPEVDLETVLFARTRSGDLLLDRVVSGNMDEFVEKGDPKKWSEKFSNEIMYAFEMHPGLWHFLVQEYDRVLESKVNEAKEKKDE